MLEISDVDYSYPGGVQALSAVNLRVNPGEKLAILGPNGAGKTTLLMLMNGTIRPGRGEIRLDQEPIGYGKAGLRALRRKVGMVLQDPDDQLFAATVFEDVSFGPLNIGLSKTEAADRVHATLAALQIGDLAERPTHMLSFGQRKRVAIAGIVAMEPKILLLDEPTAGLDPLGVVHLLAALRQVSRKGTTIVLTTHDMDTAFAWADRIAIFGDRRVACVGTPEAVFEDAQMLKRLHMRRPIIWEMAHLLRQRGIIDPTPPMPRTRRELLAALSPQSEGRPELMNSL